MMAGLVAVVLGVIVALLALPGHRQDQPPDPGKTSPDVRIFTARYIPGA